MLFNNEERKLYKSITQNHSDYEESRQAWNRAIDKRPREIIYCESNEDIIECINLSRKNNIPFAIRSGRHHYEGYSTGDDIIVIDVSKMNKIEIDEEKKEVKIQAGVRNRELYNALGELGYPFPGGGCPTVGVVGFTLGGGWGYSARLFGLGIDNLIQLEMIDYKGEVIVANKDKNQDLFWACKGSGGGNFGVIASMTFRIPNKIENACCIGLDFKNITMNENIKLVKIWQDLFKSLDERMNMKMAIYNSSERGRGVKISGLFYGSQDEANKILEPLREVNCNIVWEIAYGTVLECNNIIQDSHPDYEKYKSGGRFVYKDYSEEEIKKLITFIEDKPEGSVYAAVSFYGLGGQISKEEKSSAAFYYRDAKFIMGVQSVWEKDNFAEINRPWVTDRFRKIKEMTRGSFVNFPIDNQEDYEHEYYGENKVALRIVKAKYDPYDVFKFPQSIKLNINDK